jgi:hypothetical protein
MAFPRIGGPNIGLSTQGAIGSRVPSTVAGTIGLINPAAGSNVITLAAARTQLIPSGTYIASLGPYTSLQYKDPVTGDWTTISGAADIMPIQFDSDGANFRLANLTGTPVGGLITNAGTGLTNGVGTVTITPSAGGSVWTSVVGGAINSTVTVTAGGSLYTYAPTLVFSPPPAGGIQATGVATLSAGAVNAVTVTNQGAGYTSAPTVTVINDPRDTTGSGAVLTVNATLAGSGTLTAMYPIDPGTVLTAVPTFTFSPASTIAATAIMNFVVTGFTVGAGGAAYGNAQPFLIVVPPAIVAGTRASNTAGPISDTQLTFPRAAWINGTSTAGGAITATGAVVADAGFGMQAVPNGIVIAGGTGLATTVGQATITVGGITDTSFIQPI